MRCKNLLKKYKKLSIFSYLRIATAYFLVIHGVLTSSWAHAQMPPAPSISRTDSKTFPFELGKTFKTAGPVGKQKTRLMFYRSETSNFKGGTTVYFKGMYVATLSRHAYTSLCVNPGIGTVGINDVMAGAPSKTSLASTNTLEMHGWRNRHIRVIEDPNIQVIQMVTGQEALAELTTIRAQIHTLSLVVPVQMCCSTTDHAAAINEVATTPAAPKTLASVSAVQGRNQWGHALKHRRLHSS